MLKQQTNLPSLGVDFLYASAYTIDMKEIEFFKLENNKEPVVEWLNSLDLATQARIHSRFSRLQEDNYGDCKKLGEISELRFNFGPGYRIYFSEIDNTIVLLLNAGDKKTQKKDIEKAKEYFNAWKGQGNGQI